MTNELEKTFFDTFGIEQRGKKCTCDVRDFAKCTTYYCTSCAKALKKEYPRITPEILLELICILSEWRQYCDSDYVIKAINIDNLKEDILKDCLYMSNWYEFKKCEKNLEHQVRTLFGE